MPANSTAAASPYDRVLAAYEAIRARLADDATAKEAGAAFVEAATAASLAELATRGRAVAAATSVEAARTEFGELSRLVVALVIAHPELQRAHFVYECPMVKGYRKWIQATSDMANPYMGKAMLACGGESTWR
jgi:Cu(I)/Ag(I) efflux system membrane fusion protein